ncbi:MAG: hypothetical protein AB9861_09040 [Methanosarcina sp.]|jgi:hypothetical protein
MGKLRLKNTLAILLAVFFVMSLTAASASACSDNNKCDCDDYDDDYCDDYDDDYCDDYDDDYCDDYDDDYCDDYDDYCDDYYDDYKDRCDFGYGCSDWFSFDILLIFFGDIFDCGDCFF